ncbi:MAG: hypothetical protein JNM17_01205 [Archangium sp.]|nr:hypothetical protein [Archangium sp.]
MTSFTRLAGFAEDEQCPGDTIDNDCDGYVDELFSDAGIACGSGPVCGATGPDGILKAYRTCQAPVCPSFLFERLRDAGYEPLDRCDDNVDRDCSGEPGKGPLVAMRRAEEAVVLADPSAVGGVFRMVVVGAVSDGGTDRELRFSSWNSNLIDLNGGVDVSIGTAAADGSPINPMLQPTAVGSVISWKAGPAAFGIAYTLGSAVVLPKRFQSPYPIRSTPEVAQFVRDTLIAAEIRITGADGGTVSVAYLTTIDTSTPEGPVDAGNIYPGSPVVLRGNGGRIGVAFAGAPGGGAWLEVGTDPSLLADGGFVQFSPSASFRFRVTYNLGILDRVAMAPLFSSRTVNLGVGAQVPSVAAFALDQSSLLNVVPLSQLSTDVADLSLATRELADGGTVFLAAGRLADGSAAVFDQTSSVRRVGPASGRVSIASSPAFPEYAMLTVPRAEDGGTVIYGQMVCMPR